MNQHKNQFLLNFLEVEGQKWEQEQTWKLNY
jgi:hypothetical protein